MNNSDPDFQIQSGESLGKTPIPSGSPADSSTVENALRYGGQRQRALALSVLFGAFVGLLMGPIVGAVCCWLVGQFDFFDYAILMGSLVGTFAGASIAFLERKIRSTLMRPDIATIICVGFSLLPALIVAIQGLAFARGKFSVLVFVGAICVGPMTGLLVGATLDRAFEAWVRKTWTAVIVSAAAWIATFAGILLLLDAQAYGPDPAEVSKEAKALMNSKWPKGEPNARPVTIQNVTLVRHGRTAYTGFANVTMAGQPQRLDVEARVEGEMLEVRWAAHRALQRRD